MFLPFCIRTLSVQKPHALIDLIYYSKAIRALVSLKGHTPATFPLSNYIVIQTSKDILNCIAKLTNRLTYWIFQCFVCLFVFVFVVCFLTRT
jgi:hypothetical protein